MKEGAPPRSKFVLLVEDDPDSAEMYFEYLRYSGYRVIAARNGVDAVALAVKTRPDLVIMDLRLPLLDGVSAIRQIRANAETRHTRIIAISGTHPALSAVEVALAGADEFVSKPCLPVELAAAVGRYFPTDTAPSRASASPSEQKRGPR